MAAVEIAWQTGRGFVFSDVVAAKPKIGVEVAYVGNALSQFTQLFVDPLDFGVDGHPKCRPVLSGFLTVICRNTTD